MKKDYPNKIRCHSLRLGIEEYAKIEIQSKASTCRNKSEYIRNLILNRPVTILYRNQSLDDLIEEIVILNSEINATKNDLSQYLEMLYVHKNSIDFKKSLQDVELMIVSLYKKMDEVKQQIEKITDKWLQS